MGGGLTLTNGNCETVGTNSFVGNVALNEGGAIYANEADLLLNGLEQFSQNSVNGDLTATSANIFIDAATSVVHYPSGFSPPPFTSGPASVFPITYVDVAATCGVSCTGQMSAPYTSLGDALYEGYSKNGGYVYVMPGIYTGPNNTNLYLDEQITISRWPGTNGEIVLDCQGSGYGFSLYNNEFFISDLTIRNCVTTVAGGGGAIVMDQEILELNNVALVSNSATFNGGAMVVTLGSFVNMRGGQIVNNSVSQPGAAGGAYVSGVLRLYSNVVVSNQGTDAVCTSSGEILTDGSVSLAIGQNSTCVLQASSISTTAIFPGGFQAILPTTNPSRPPISCSGSWDYFRLVKWIHLALKWGTFCMRKISRGG